MNKKTITEELAERLGIANKTEYCTSLEKDCIHKISCYSVRDESHFFVCGYFKEVLNENVRAEICFDTFGIAGKN